MTGSGELLTDRRRVICGLCAGAAVLTVYPSAGSGATIRPFCGYSLDDNSWDGTGAGEYVGRRASGPRDRSGVPQVVRRINELLSINPRFEIIILQGEDNAFAAVAGGRRIIAVDVGFVDRLNRRVGTEWAAISVIAHEIGHHIAGFGPTRFRAELNADYWSGQALQRLGSARNAAMRAMEMIGTARDTPTHPNKRSRMAKIAQGWDDAAKGHIDYSHCMDCR